MTKAKREEHKAEGPMVHVQVPTGVAPRQVEGFPKGCDRSVKGALHIRPGTMEMTEGELAHVRKHHKEIARRLIIIKAKALPADAAVQAAPSDGTESDASAASETPAEGETKSESTPQPPRGTGQHRGGKLVAPKG